MNDWVFDSGDRDFNETVVARSRAVPVVVDFWAPWCGPCKVLGPLLERLAAEHGGEFYLAKVNVDENPALAEAFRVQSIPLVVGLRDGQVVAEAVGAMPEADVRAFLQRVLPSPAQRQAAEAETLLAAGKIDEAEALVGQALELEPRNESATLARARILAERRQTTEALELLERIGPGPVRHEADRLAAALRVRGDAAGDEGRLQSQVADHPDDLDARVRLGRTLAAAAKYEEALQQYLEVVRRDKEFDEGVARKAMLDIFELVGAGSPLVEQYRAELAKVLFS